ncbi:MAG: hypothetical protein ACI32C_04325 [Candidatus Enteromonas sp.]
MKKPEIETILNDLQAKLDVLSKIEIPFNPDIETVLSIKQEVTKIREDFLNCFDNVIEGMDEFENDQVDAIFNEYERFKSWTEFFYTQLNCYVLDENAKCLERLETKDKESVKILPQIITFSSLFVSAIGLIVSNIAILDSFSLKNILVTNLTFVFAVGLAFYIFGLLWSNIIDEKYRKRLST